MKYITILDTTLRDGDQAPGFHFLRREKLVIARQLAKLGVDVIEAGFAASSDGDFDIVKQIAKEFSKSGPGVCSLARAVDSDIERAADAVAPANKPRVHIVLGTSNNHLEKKLRKNKMEAIKQIDGAIRKARTYMDEVEFSCEDFGRSDLDYIAEVAIVAITAGANVINLPDSVGILTPHEAFTRVNSVISKLRSYGCKDAVFSVHNHNDMGMATGNTIEGIAAGATQVEVTINGIGERAGNTALEEVVAAIKTKSLGRCGVNTRYIAETSRMCAEFTKVPQANKAIVGENAFKHASGIHQNAVLKHRSTYEVINPEDYGFSSSLAFGPRSGRTALRHKYASIGYSFRNKRTFEEVYMRFKEFAEDKKEVSDKDLRLIARGYAHLSA